jgi:hypothetical protein
MNRPRLSLGLESSRPTLDEAVCVRIGQELAAERSLRHRTIREVAERLLLSPRQVQGLEIADHDAFYSAEFYVTALRKYHALFGLSPDLIDQVLVPADPLPTVAPSPKPPAALPARRAMVSAAAAVLAAVGIGGWLVSLGVADNEAGVDSPSSPLTLQHLVSHQLPVSMSRVSLAAPGPLAGPEFRAEATGEGFGHIRVARTTWVFVRYQDNSTVERIVSPGQRFVLSGVPVYLAAGDAPGAEIVIAGQAVDPERFNVNGQLRIGSAFLSAALRR